MKHAALVLVAVALGGCPADGGSCTEFEKGDSYTVEVIEKWDENSSFAFELTPDSDLPPCEVDDVEVKTYDWHISDTLRTGHTNNCYLPVCPDDFPTDSESRPEGTYRGGEWLCVNKARKATEMACEVARFVGFETINRKTDPFDAPVKGQLPPVVLHRTLRYGQNGGDELTCADPSVVFSDESLMSSPTGEFYKCGDSWVVRLKKK